MEKTSFKIREDIFTVHFFTICSIFAVFIIFTTIYSLYTPTWEESDGWFHWNFIELVGEGKFDAYYYERQQPLYYVINGAFVSFFDHKVFSDDSFAHTKRNFYEDFNYFRHISEDEFKFGEVNFQKGCVGECTGLPEKFPYEGISLGVHSLRFFSIFCGFITLIFVYKISKIVFPQSKWLPLYVTSFTALIPQFTFINSVLGPEALAITFSTITVFFLLKFVNTQYRKYLICVSIFCGLALLTKTDTLFLIPVVVGSCFYLSFSKKISKKEFLIILALFFSILILSGGWWYFVFPTQASIVSSRLLDYFSLETETSDEIQSQENIASEKIQNLLDTERHHFVYFESVWGNIGWKALKTPVYILDIIKILYIVSLSGLILVISKKSFHYKKTISKTHLIILILVVTLMLASMLAHQAHSDRGTGRNLLPAISGFSVLFTLGLYAILNKNFLKPLLLFPIALLFFINVGMFFEMNEKFEHGLPRDPLYDANHDLRTEIWLGKGTSIQNEEPVARLRNLFQEDGHHDTILLMHPPQSGKKWWNFTMSLPQDKNYDLQIIYGFAANAKGRNEPVEYAVLFDDKTIMKDTKSYTGQLSNFDVDLDPYNSDSLNVSLSTDSLDYGYNKAWSFFKLKFIK